MQSRITRRYHFEAAHYLPKVGPEHKCSRMHGHNYEVEVTVDGHLGDNGFIMDFADLDEIVDPVIRLIDHRCLNDTNGLENPTAEIIGRWFLAKLAPMDRRISMVRVYETKDCWADAITG